jgi:beta-glucosidase
MHQPSARRPSSLAAVVAGTLGVVLALGTASPPSATGSPQARRWMNTALSPDERAALLLAQMTLAEKVELMTGDQGAAPSAFYNAPIPRLGIPELRMADATDGIASRGWSLPGTGDRATAMPASIALAATFDPRTAARYAGVVAAEARETGHEMLLGPNSDPSRQPFWGRQAESAGEDPELNSSIVVPFVKTLQARHVIADLKHYTGYTQEVNRGAGQNDVVSERALREVHTRTYKDAIRKADLGSVMCSFNKINGAYSCENQKTLGTILRQQLGFKGFVITDFGAIHSTAPSIRAGTDMETGTAAFYDGALLAAVQGGTVPESLVNRSVRRILRTMFAIGVFDHDYTPTSIPVRPHGRVARQVQTEAVTLLKNSTNTLPLSRVHSGSIAVIGADATTTSALAGSALVQPTYRVPLLRALRARAAQAGVGVRYVAGNDPVNGASMIETADMTAVPSSVLTPETGAGHGLSASYFANPTWSGTPGVTRIERQVLYDVGFTGGSPAFASLFGSQLPATPALSSPIGGGDSVRYTGFLTAPRTGTYRLGLTGWGDAKVWLGDQLIVDMTGQDGRRVVQSAPVHLEAGEQTTIRVDYAATRPLVGLQPGTLVLQWSTPAGVLPPSVRAAARAARQSRAAVVYVRTYETEERDRVSLKLPQNAGQLIRAVSAANPRTIVVIASGGPVTMPWAKRVPAILDNYLGGQEEGTALAKVIFGDVAPSGRLPVTFPRSEEALPPGVDNPWETIDDLDVPFTEGVNLGYRDYLASGVRPRYPFGYGLTYTTFGYRGLHTSGVAAGGPRATAHVRFTVTNTGRRRAAEVAQVYLGPPAGLAAPVRKLGAYDKLTLAPGERRIVTLAVPRRAFSYWNSGADRWVTPRGAVHVFVGRSSTDIRLNGTIHVR